VSNAHDPGPAGVDGQAADVAEHEHVLSDRQRLVRVGLACLLGGAVYGAVIGREYGRRAAWREGRVDRLSSRVVALEVADHMRRGVDEPCAR
jgi:hypothetical protein